MQQVLSKHLRPLLPLLGTESQAPTAPPTAPKGDTAPPGVLSHFAKCSHLPVLSVCLRSATREASP